MLKELEPVLEKLNKLGEMYMETHRKCFASSHEYIIKQVVEATNLYDLRHIGHWLIHDNSEFNNFPEISTLNLEISNDIRELVETTPIMVLNHLNNITRSMHYTLSQIDKINFDSYTKDFRKSNSDIECGLCGKYCDNELDKNIHLLAHHFSVMGPNYKEILDTLEKYESYISEGLKTENLPTPGTPAIVM
jgi:hypothetical protein